MTEQWKPVAGFEGKYEVSDLGRVRSFQHKSAQGKILKAGWKGAGYSAVILCHPGQRVSVKVHHLVLLAFVGPRPDNKEGCHNDSNKSNNCANNLRWDTHLGNIADKSHKLDEIKVLQIRADPRSNAKVAAIYGVDPRTVSSVKRRKLWAHVAERIAA